MLIGETASKRGYLNEDFRLFHLKDSRAQKVDYHYHEFDKLILLLGGKVAYLVEGVTYFLQPWDVLLVQHNLIHRPIIDPSEPYERVVIYLNSGFLRSSGTRGEDLGLCFDLARERQFALMRPGGGEREGLERLLESLERALEDRGFGGDLLARTCFLQLLVRLNRDMMRDRTHRDQSASQYDPKIAQALSYINDHLGEELTIERLSGAFFLSRYYLMHRFKAVYGCTVPQYIRQKRLQRAAGDIRRGVPILKAAGDAGFGDYSVFLRAFRSAYGRSPREWK